MRKYFQWILLVVFGLFNGADSLLAQNLPNDWQLSPDGRRLIIGSKDATGLYDSTTIRSMYLTFTQSNWYTIMQGNYSSHTDLAATLVVDGTTYPNVGVRFKGQTSYMQVSTQKKSFNISLDYQDPSQELMGYQTLNLNNAFADESFIREVFYLNQIKQHIPAAKGNYVHLYINGQDWGLYPSVQQLNKDFLKEWYLSNDGANWRADRPTGGGGPGWGDGTAALNYLGTDTSTYKQHYILKSADAVSDPWTKLLTVCDKLENTPANTIEQILPNYLDIDRTLWFLASEIAFSDDDSYIYKGRMDYYCYYEPETGRLTPQEYDGNSVIDPSHVNWSAFYNEANANYPLLNIVLSIPKWRQRYLAHLRTVIADELDPTTCNAIIDNYKAQIDSLVQADPKKLYTYTQFNNEIPVLKNFISNRRNYLNSNSEVAEVAPVISTVTRYDQSLAPWADPLDMETAWVTAQVGSFNGIDHVSLYYATGLVGNFAEMLMYDDGLHQDGSASDGLYGAELPAYPGGTWVRFYVEAIAANASKSASYMPKGAEHDVYVYTVAPLVSSSNGVVINELMASNASTATDSLGEYDDWIELYNTTSQTIDLSGWYLTDNPANLAKWEIPAGTVIGSGSYLIVWADEDSAQGLMHANFKLSALGETLWLLDTSLAMVDSVAFGAQGTDMGYARVPNGTGAFVAQAPTFSANNNSPTALAQAQPGAGLIAYPNPSHEQLHVRLLGQDAQHLAVFNAVGMKVYETEAKDATTIPTHQLPSGIYILQGSSERLRFVVAH